MIQESNQLNTSFVHEYNTPGVYNVTIKAWNTMFIQTAHIILRVESSIPEGCLMLFPETDNIPFPDGKIDMFLNYTGTTNPDPTNVRCIFQYGDGVEEIHKVHFYNSTGTKDVNFTCTNDLSEQSVFATIHVGQYSLSDFKFEYKDPVPMNMTLKRTHPTENYRHFYKSETVPVIVTFKISLKNFSRFPPDINVTWNFGDGSPDETSTLESKTRIHKYTGDRGIHDIVIIMASKMEAITFHRSITLGVASFNCTPPNVTIRDTVTCEVQGIPVNSTYEIDTDSISANLDKANNQITYRSYGFYIPSVFTQAGEKIYLDQPIISDYDLENVLDLNIRPDQVPLSPGKVSFNVSSDDVRPYVYCSMTSGDAVDRDGVYIKIQNITYSEPLVFDYVYTSLGTHTVNVTCWNYISKKTFLENVTVINAIIDSNGIFDRHYSLSSQPMPVYTSNDVYISNRMNILCNDEKPNFKWKIYEANVQGNTDKDTQYENPLNEEKGTLLIKRGKLPDGIYHILLNVSLSTTLITEWMYLFFKSPLPRAYIIGGDYVLGAWDYKFDALTESHTVNGDLGDNQHLTFTWECKRVSFTNLTGPTINLKETTGNLCNVKELSPGVIQIPDAKQTPSDYAVTVTVKEGSSEKKFKQIANLRGENATKLRINCILNCNDKVAVSSKFALEAECDSCKLEDDIRYFWQLWTSDGGKFHPWQNIVTTTGKDNTSQSLVLPKFFLNSSQTYLVTLSMKGVNKTEFKGTIYRKLETNKPPSGGYCSVGLKTDPPLVLLSVNCSDWTDADGNDVFIYRYETVTKRNLHHGQENVVSFLYEGGERSVLDVPIQFGDPDCGNVVTIRVRVLDFFGDYGTFSKDIKEDKTTTEEEVTGGAERLVIDTSGGGPVFLTYQQKVIKLLTLVKTVVTPGCMESEYRFNLADLQTIFSTMDALTRYQPYLSMEAVNKTTEILDTVISCLEVGSRRRPFAPRSLETLNDIATVLHRIFNNILHKMLPEKLQDLNEELSEEAIKGDMIIGIERFLQDMDLLHRNHGNITLYYSEINRRAHMLYRIRSHYRQMQILQRETAKKIIPIIKEILNIFVNVLQKTVVAGEKIIFEGLGELDIMIRKLS